MEPKMNINDKINMRVMLERFLDIMIEKFQQSMDEVGILGNDIAYNSFKKSIFYSGGSVERATVDFNKYLRFVDMGVGKGMPIGTRRELGDSRFFRKRWSNGRLKDFRRKPKKWYGKTKVNQIFRLREILIRDYSINILQELESGLQAEQIKINLR